MMKTLIVALCLLLHSISSAQTLTIDCGSSNDQYFTGGSTFVSTTHIAGDRTLRFGAFQYKIPRLPGLYKLTLYFRETGTVTAPNQRRFSVRANGQLLPTLTDFDLFATANITEFKHEVFAISDGFILLDFSYTLRSAVVSRIEVTSLPNLSIEPGYGLLLKLYSADAINRKFEINTTIIFHRVLVPTPNTPCDDSAAMAVDRNTIYFCVEGTWTAFPQFDPVR